MDTHKSLLGSFGANVGQILFELMVNVVWARYYSKFLTMLFLLGLECRDCRIEMRLI